MSFSQKMDLFFALKSWAFGESHRPRSPFPFTPEGRTATQRAPPRRRILGVVGPAKRSMSSPRKGGGKTAAWGDVSGRERPPITAPGRALFAVVLSPRDVDDPEDARCVPRAATFLPTAGRERDHAGRVFRVFAPAVGSRSRDGRHARTSRRRHSRLFFPTRRTARLPDFSEPPPPSAQGQRQGEPSERAAPVSYRRAGVGRRRLPRRRCPLPRRRPGARAAGARTPRRARGPRQPHAHSARRRRGVHARVPGARRAQGQGHRPEDEAPGAQRRRQVLVRAHR